jgi:hypothetical protein
MTLLRKRQVRHRAEQDSPGNAVSLSQTQIQSSSTNSSHTSRHAPHDKLLPPDQPHSHRTRSAQLMSSSSSQAHAPSVETTDERNVDSFENPRKFEEAHKVEGPEIFKDLPPIPENEVAISKLNPFLDAARAKVLEQHRKASGQREMRNS